MARTQIRGNTQIMAGTIGNTEIAADAAIAYSKLNLVGELTNTDVATDAAIAYSKLDLALSVDNGDIATDAAVAYSKLNLALSILNADVATDAAIVESKVAFDTTTGHNHDGTNSRLVSGIAIGKFDISREIPTGLVDGTNAVYTLASTPSSGSEHLWLNGNLQDEGTAEDYTISGAIVTMLSAPQTNAKIRVSYGTD